LISLMPSWDQLVHDLKEVVEARRKTFVRATVLDRDSRELSSGTATPLSEGVHGSFWPDDPKQKDIPPSNAAKLHRSDGTESKLVRFEYCPQSAYSPHYHFETEL
jgi:hypothetical protein